MKAESRVSRISHIALLLFCIIAWLGLERKPAAFMVVAIAGAVHVADAVADLVKARRRRKAAARALGAHASILRLEHGYDTEMRERRGTRTCCGT